jgi:hypothetical protein
MRVRGAVDLPGEVVKSKSPSASSLSALSQFKFKQPERLLRADIATRVSDVASSCCSPTQVYAFTSQPRRLQQENEGAVSSRRRLCCPLKA